MVRMSRQVQCCRSFSTTRAMGLESWCHDDVRRICAKLCCKRVGDLVHINILAGACVDSDHGTVFRAEQDFISREWTT